ISDYNEAIRLKPDYAEAYNNRGNAKLALGDKQGAINDFNQAIRIKPDLAEVYLNRGLAKSDLGMIQSALEDLQEARRLSQRNGDTTLHEKVLKEIRRISPYVFYDHGNTKVDLASTQSTSVDFQ
ncbi:MAG: tetratricopeptide repeat protein, partial [Pseudanabaena sp. ELA607]